MGKEKEEFSNSLHDSLMAKNHENSGKFGVRNLVPRRIIN